ncbi:AmmeMemoRadiSam system protein A [Telmatospirillum sp. J64-1]|uniref:AmmeMemoRadiSam system protein A n=1 Tax=Telmatospirillum sp. J64-1 TaxID=2502183 RepID=UPI00115D7EAA|nr:AmmeMemoRadiSam system protein A [Telmatospirillum sp. J64-1]
MTSPETALADFAQTHGRTMLDLAWRSLRHGLETGTPLPADQAACPPALTGQQGACFVTLKHRDELRGCIGSAQAWRSWAEDVCANAFQAAFRDPRFPPLRAAETEHLRLSVSLLSAPEAMTFDSEASLLAQLRPGIDGLIIEDGRDRALFLPSVWESLPDPQDFLDHLRDKAGLHPRHWSPRFRAQRFVSVEVKE